MLLLLLLLLLKLLLVLICVRNIIGLLSPLPFRLALSQVCASCWSWRVPDCAVPG